MYKKINTVHLIGIGGIGMSGIAELLTRHGYVVSGSDLKASETIRHLEGLGIRVMLGHAQSHVNGAELVVYSSAIGDDNPEIVAAIDKKIPLISRTEMLAELMRIKYGIAVAGTHGKTTTTSMIATILMEADWDPTIVVGGRMDNFGGTNARLGSGEFMVVEADESDGSFNKLSPSIAVVTNIDREHMDHYKTMRRLKAAFLSFMNGVPFYGLSVFCGDDPSLRLLQHRVRRRKKTFGFREENTYRIVTYRPNATTTECELNIDGREEVLKLQVPGRHNVLNALAALAVSDELSIPRETALKALLAYHGVQRRLQNRGEKNGVLFIDDYAHHPTEIKATLGAMRERFPTSKIRAVFQPHRFSRVEDLFYEFSHCFKTCESLAITDIYAAGEAPIPGVESSLLVDNIKRLGYPDVHYVPRAEDAILLVMKHSSPGDIIVTLGAGDLPNVYKQLF